MDTTTGIKENVLSYEKVKWEQWCQIHDREERGVRIIEVENTSFTGDNGCHLIWNLKVSPSTELVLNQKSGKILGKGPLFNLKIHLAAGKLEWSQSNMPIQIDVAAGKVVLKEALWPKKQSSSISVASGSIYIESPKDSPVITKVSNAVGSEENDFDKSGQDFHELKINVAVGKAQHKSY